MPISGSILPIAGKAGYKITDDPYEPTSLFENQGGTSEDVSSDIVMFETGENQNLISGDSLSTLMGKIRYFIQNIGTTISGKIFADATVTNTSGTPFCLVTKDIDASGTTFHFAFHNVKGERGATGATGASGTDGRDGTDGTDGISPVVSATASVDSNVGIPSVNVTKGGTDANPVFNFAFHNLKGETGASGSDGSDGQDGISPEVSATATVDNNVGTPSVSVTKSGTDAEPVFNFAFHNLKGQAGANGTNGTDGADGITPAITMQATVDNYSGTPSVQVNQSGTTANPVFELEFHNLKGADGSNGRGVIAGGNTGDVLCKKSNASFDTEWRNISGSILPMGGTTGQALVKRSNADRDVEWQTIQSGSIMPIGGYQTKTIDNIDSDSISNETLYEIDGNVRKKIHINLKYVFRLGSIPNNTYDGDYYTYTEPYSYNPFYDDIEIDTDLINTDKTNILNPYIHSFDYNFYDIHNQLCNIHGYIQVQANYDSVSDKTIIKIIDGKLAKMYDYNSGETAMEYHSIEVKGWCVN